jgi:hypothetical protein
MERGLDTNELRARWCIYDRSGDCARGFRGLFRGGRKGLIGRQNGRSYFLFFKKRSVVNVENVFEALSNWNLTHVTEGTEDPRSRSEVVGSHMMEKVPTGDDRVVTEEAAEEPCLRVTLLCLTNTPMGLGTDLTLEHSLG